MLIPFLKQLAEELCSIKYHPYLSDGIFAIVNVQISQSEHCLSHFEEELYPAPYFAILVSINPFYGLFYYV